MTHENKETSKEEREEQFKLYILLNNIKLNQSNNLDRNLITLSSAAVGLIVSVLIQNNLLDIFYLKISLACFVITIMSTVISFYISIKAVEKEVSYLNNDIKKKGDYGNNYWSLPIEIITMVSIISFFSGVLSLLKSYF